MILALFLVITLTSATFAMDNGVNTSSSLVKSYLIGFYVMVNKEVINTHGGKVKKQFKHIPVVSVELSEQAFDSLSMNPKIAYIEEDAKVSINNQTIPWGIPHIQTTEAHQQGFTGKKTLDENAVPLGNSFEYGNGLIKVNN
ncbi:protease inhibitor I9 family protein [Tepidibacillus infernus]|uniref:Uncharacterized protein n=2 Tax=Tepidibacillus TaxID=1494427 RepID=A0A135L305_9BACI|nr:MULTISPECIES: protease inhibitor I9 family protein [Tepidibacillus]KXG43233.1 hypothetical protein U473_03790 [Tepidibacillus decaturensis]TCS83967.1 peptidase inhibitor I9 [Tepidibacillus fermentans]